jgi:membrane-associated phospholipid phosphatase
MNDSNISSVIDNKQNRDGTEKNKNLTIISVPIKQNENDQFKYNKENIRYIKNCINYLDRLDKQISRPLHNYCPNIKKEFIFYIFARLFNIDTVILYLISVLIYSFLKYKNGYFAIIPICHVIVGALFTIILKVIIRRPRPILRVKKKFKLKENTHSMPSGDSLQAAVFATMIILYNNNNFKFLSVVLIPAAMLGRIFYNLHYWFDCIIGAIIGIFISIGTYNVISIFKNKYLL